MSDTTSILKSSNAALREAVEQRRAAVNAGLPAEQWYDHEAVSAAARERIELGVVDESELGILPQDIETARQRSPMAASIAGCRPAMEACAAILSEPRTCTTSTEDLSSETYSDWTPPDYARRIEAVKGFKRLIEETRPAREARATHPSSQAFYDLCDELKAIHRTKSIGYGSEDDPLANIRNGATFVGIEPWRAAMVRLSDKVTRLQTYCRTGTLTCESFDDNCIDLASYALLVLLMHRESRDAAS